MTMSHFFTLSNAIRAMLIFGFIALFGVIVQSCQGVKSPLDRFAVDSLKGLTQLDAQPMRPANMIFQDLSGADVTLASFDGQVTLVNAWATWCPPCVAEMPSLDELQRLRGGRDFQVIGISADRTLAEVQGWIEDNAISNMNIWHDKSYRMTGEMNIPGFPTTIIYGRDGQEITRLSGEADWASPEALALIDYLIAQ